MTVILHAIWYFTLTITLIAMLDFKLTLFASYNTVYQPFSLDCAASTVRWFSEMTLGHISVMVSANCKHNRIYNYHPRDGFLAMPVGKLLSVCSLRLEDPPTRGGTIPWAGILANISEKKVPSSSMHPLSLHSWSWMWCDHLLHPPDRMDCAPEL